MDQVFIHTDIIVLSLIERMEFCCCLLLFILHQANFVVFVFEFVPLQLN